MLSECCGALSAAWGLESLSSQNLIGVLNGSCVVFGKRWGCGPVSPTIGKRNDESPFGVPWFCFPAGWFDGDFQGGMGGFGEAGCVRCERDDDCRDAGLDSRGEGDVSRAGGG